MNRKLRFIYVLFLLGLLIFPLVILADEPLHNSNEENVKGQKLDKESDSTLEEKGEDINISYIMYGSTKFLKPGFPKIIESLQDYKDFIFSADNLSEKQSGTSEIYSFKAEEKIDFEKNVMVIVVVPPPTDSCKAVTIGGAKRFHKDQIQLIVLTYSEISCEPHSVPILGNDILGTVFSRPVKHIDVVFKDKIFDFRNLPKIQIK